SHIYLPSHIASLFLSRHTARVEHCTCRFVWLFPKPKSAEKRVVVIAQSTAVRQLLQFLGIAAPDHDLVRFKRGDQPLDHIFNMLTPALLAQSLEPGATEVVLVGGLLVAQMPKLHRLDYAINNHGGAEPGPQAEK